MAGAQSAASEVVIACHPLAICLGNGIELPIVRDHTA
jgi:hypothetical protein